MPHDPNKLDYGTGDKPEVDDPLGFRRGARLAIVAIAALLAAVVIGFYIYGVICRHNGWTY
jgi:hypothetical protein